MEKLQKAMVKTGDFCKVVDNSCESDGIPKGTVVYIAGLKVLPIDKTDPYIQKIFPIVNVMKGKVLDTELCLMNPSCLKRLGPASQKQYNSQLELLFGDTNASIN